MTKPRYRLLCELVLALAFLGAAWSLNDLTCDVLARPDLPSVRVLYLAWFAWIAARAAVLLVHADRC